MTEMMRISARHKKILVGKRLPCIRECHVYLINDRLGGDKIWCTEEEAERWKVAEQTCLAAIRGVEQWFARAPTRLRFYLPRERQRVISEFHRRILAASDTYFPVSCEIWDRLHPHSRRSARRRRGTWAAESAPHSDSPETAGGGEASLYGPDYDYDYGYGGDHGGGDGGGHSFGGID